MKVWLRLGGLLLVLAITIEYYVHYFNNKHLTQMQMCFEERPISMGILIIVIVMLALTSNKR